MIQFKRKSVSLTLLLFTTLLFAQNTNSVYSRFGYGILENPAMGKARSMGGIGYGIHDRQLLNVLNPASYADVDTLNMLFELGLSGQLTAFKEGSQHQYNPNFYVDNVGMKFALKPNWGVAFGLYQYSKVGYEFHSSETLVDPLGSDLSYVNTYIGTGGLNNVFLGTGMKVFKGFSLGANLNYTFGMIGNITATTYSTSGINNVTNLDYVFLSMPGVDLGFQYDYNLTPKSKLTVGMSFSSWLSDSGEEFKSTIATDTLETTTYSTYELGNTLGLGLSYQYDKKWTVGLDLQRKMFSQSLYKGVSDSLKDYTRLALGVEYLPSTTTNNYFKAVRYRMGLQLADQYLKEPGQFKSAALTFGLGLPLLNQKSTVNIGFEMGKLITPNATFIDESYYKVSLGVTFNERWFLKLKL